MFYFLLFFVGTAFGSFLNVLALRYRPGRLVFSWKDISGRSRCPHCKKDLRWFELVPILSFMILRGRCARCRAGISIQYPIVEFLSGAIFVAVPWHFSRFFLIGNFFAFREGLWGFYVFTALWILVFWVLLLISVIDLRHYLVPDELNALLGFLGIAVLGVKLFFGQWMPPLSHYFVGNYAVLLSPVGGILSNHLLGLVAGGLFFFAIVFISRGKAMGMGDVKLAAALGLLVGLPDAFLMIFFAFTSGGLFGAMAIIFQKKSIKSMIPFAPFIAFGVFMVVFSAHAALRLYFGIFGIL